MIVVKGFPYSWMSQTAMGKRSGDKRLQDSLSRKSVARRKKPTPSTMTEVHPAPGKEL